MRQKSIPDLWAQIRIRYLPKAGVVTTVPQCMLEEVEFYSVADHAKILVCIPTHVTFNSCLKFTLAVRPTT